MEAKVFFAVMAAAALHAGWNALLKIGLDRFLSASLIQIGAGLVALPLLPLVSVPQLAAWPWITLSAVLHIGYNIFLARAYGHGDLGQVYPLARGASPLLVAMASIPLLGDSLSAGQLAALLTLVGGLWLMAWLGNRQHAGIHRQLLLDALLTALFIAGYTLADANGARANGQAVAYALWLFAVNGLVMALVLLLMRGPGVWRPLLGQWRGGLAGGGMSLLAYGIAIWAMTQAPVALVSALRESSVLFALLLGVVWLKEPLPRGRLLACGVIAGGVALMKLA